MQLGFLFLFVVVVVGGLPLQCTVLEVCLGANH